MIPTEIKPLEPNKKNWFQKLFSRERKNKPPEAEVHEENKEKIPVAPPIPYPFNKKITTVAEQIAKIKQKKIFKKALEEINFDDLKNELSFIQNLSLKFAEIWQENPENSNLVQESGDNFLKVFANFLYIIYLNEKFYPHKKANLNTDEKQQIAKVLKIDLSELEKYLHIIYKNPTTEEFTKIANHHKILAETGKIIYISRLITQALFNGQVIDFSRPEFKEAFEIYFKSAYGKSIESINDIEIKKSHYQEFLNLINQTIDSFKKEVPRSEYSNLQIKNLDKIFGLVPENKSKKIFNFNFKSKKENHTKNEGSEKEFFPLPHDTLFLAWLESILKNPEKDPLKTRIATIRELFLSLHHIWEANSNNQQLQENSQKHVEIYKNFMYLTFKIDDFFVHHEKNRHLPLEAKFSLPFKEKVALARDLRLEIPVLENYLAVLQADPTEESVKKIIAKGADFKLIAEFGKIFRLARDIQLSIASNKTIDLDETFLKNSLASFLDSLIPNDATNEEKYILQDGFYQQFINILSQLDACKNQKIKISNAKTFSEQHQPKDSAGNSIVKNVVISTPIMDSFSKGNSMDIEKLDAKKVAQAENENLDDDFLIETLTKNISVETNNAPKLNVIAPEREIVKTNTLTIPGSLSNSLDIKGKLKDERFIYPKFADLTQDADLQKIIFEALTWYFLEKSHQYSLDKKNIAAENISIVIPIKYLRQEKIHYATLVVTKSNLTLPFKDNYINELDTPYLKFAHLIRKF